MNRSNSDRDDSKVARRLKRLIEANHSLADMELLEEVLPRLLDLARDVTEAEASSLLLYNPERNVLEFASVKDEVVGDRAGAILKSSVELEMGEGIAGWVAENRKSIIIPDAQRDPRFSKRADRKTGFITQSLLCVPLIHRDELLGVINVLNPKDKHCFDIEDQDILESFANLAAVALVRSKLLETRLQQERFQTQLLAAARIQSLFWPKLPEAKGGSHIWTVSAPAAFVGGDLYDVIPMPDGSWLVYVADVSDKGLPAALIMAALSIMIRGEALSQDELDKLLESVNDAMYELMSDEGFFATVVIGKYWSDTGKMELSLGGHLPPLWVGENGFKHAPDLQGIALGVVPRAKYKKSEIVLSPGDSILFVTDGVTEAENERNEFFGHRRLVDSLLKASGPPRGIGLLDEVKAWRGVAEASDDLTMLEIWRTST
ncbi:MAG: SpoIIE family protein phosphatase [Deltaproteobacteria bacterium]|nr:MAG: SpoIIE family protein phosphatase [Deltaproteobacteria bacterium]